jgi:hypothetical protein
VKIFTMIADGYSSHFVDCPLSISLSGPYRLQEFALLELVHQRYQVDKSCSYIENIYHILHLPYNVHKETGTIISLS